MTENRRCFKFEYFDVSHAEWLDDNIEGRWFLLGIQEWDDTIEDYIGEYITHVEFELEIDAMAFKLRWM